MERRSIAGGQLRRVSSRNALKRSLSAPLLTPLWEPHEDVPAYLHSEPGKSPARALHPGGPSVSGRGPAAGGPWNKVLLLLEQQLLLSPVAQQVDPAHLAALTSAPTTMEFLAAVHDGIRRDSQPMRLQTGLVEKRYDIKQLLSSGVSYKVRSRRLPTMASGDTQPWQRPSFDACSGDGRCAQGDAQEPLAQDRWARRSSQAAGCQGARCVAGL